MNICDPPIEKEVETDQVREKTEEIMNINHDIESKFEKSDEQETVWFQIPAKELKFGKEKGPLLQGGTLNSHPAASHLVKLLEGEERWEDLSTLKVFSLKIGVGPSKIVLSL
ncbi:hypothetical protein TNCV_3886571 [Trichonephila clavipes]|nr:hypothetical protein TNCV_3886571 [Trichonephila clavipes]